MCQCTGRCCSRRAVLRHSHTCFVFHEARRDCSGDPQTAVAAPTTAVECSSAAVACPPTAVGCTPTAVGYTPTAVGCTPTAVDHNPTVEPHFTDVTCFFFFFGPRTPRLQPWPGPASRRHGPTQPPLPSLLLRPCPPVPCGTPPPTAPDTGHTSPQPPQVFPPPASRHVQSPGGDAAVDRVPGPSWSPSPKIPHRRQSRGLSVSTTASSSVGLDAVISVKTYGATADPRPSPDRRNSLGDRRKSIGDRRKSIGGRRKSVADRRQSPPDARQSPPNARQSPPDARPSPPSPPQAQPETQLFHGDRRKSFIDVRPRETHTQRHGPGTQRRPSQKACRRQWQGGRSARWGGGWPVDRGTWTAKTVKRPRRQPAQPPIRQLLGAIDAQTAHPATSSTAPAHQRLGSANAETTPAGAPAAAADRTQRPDVTCEGKSG